MSATEFCSRAVASAKAGLSYFKLSFVRYALYGSIVAWGMFMTGTEGFDKWSDMTAFQHFKLCGNMLFSGFGGVMLAFLDQTISSMLKQNRVDSTQPPAQTPDK